MNKTPSPLRKQKSATVSNLALFGPSSERMDKNDRMQLAMKDTRASTANSSKKVVAERCNTRNEVISMKQMPSKLLEAFKMCDDFSFSDFITSSLISR
jgi:hypothetical protein